MNIIDAITAMLQGHKITHEYFASTDEWMMLDCGMFIFEDGVECSPEEFWKYRTSTDLSDGESSTRMFWEGWSIYEEPILPSMTINKFIQKLQNISPDKRDLPLEIECPNGILVAPSIKMRKKDDRLFGDVIAMVISWR